jgi:very-short-patch-repair endonuclease
MLPNLHNKTELKEYRRSLRNNLTPAEAVLWKALKNKQLEGRKFRRQHSIGNYIVDFYCPAEKLAIELDGQDHYIPKGERKDQIKTAYLNRLGINVLHFENKIVWEMPNAILERISEEFNR